MQLYGILINHQLKIENQEVAKSKGYPLVEVEEGEDGTLWEVGYVPAKPLPTNEEQKQNRANAYQQEVDPITSHIQRLRDEEQTEEVIAKIEELKQERSDKVQEIKERYPYYEEQKDAIEEG